MLGFHENFLVKVSLLREKSPFSEGLGGGVVDPTPPSSPSSKPHRGTTAIHHDFVERWHWWKWDVKITPAEPGKLSKAIPWIWLGWSCVCESCWGWWNFGWFLTWWFFAVVSLGFLFVSIYLMIVDQLNQLGGCPSFWAALVNVGIWKLFFFCHHHQAVLGVVSL